MKSGEGSTDMGDREIIIPAKIRTVDKYGRLFVGVDFAGKEIVLVGYALKEGDKGRFEK
jgi:hypothetical protein